MFRRFSEKDHELVTVVSDNKDAFLVSQTGMIRVPPQSWHDSNPVQRDRAPRRSIHATAGGVPVVPFRSHGHYTVLDAEAMVLEHLMKTLILESC